MEATITKNIIIQAISDYSTEMVVIAGAVVTVIVGFFVLRAGLTAMLGGYGHGEGGGYKYGNGYDKHRDTFNDPNFKY